MQGLVLLRFEQVMFVHLEYAPLHLFNVPLLFAGLILFTDELSYRLSVFQLPLELIHFLLLLHFQGPSLLLDHPCLQLFLGKDIRHFFFEDVAQLLEIVVN